MKYIIGTRGSKLALVQATQVKNRLMAAYPENEFEIRVISTKGDRVQDKPLNAIGDKGLFVTEIENEILNGTVQIGVHSMKDMPAEPAEGLIFSKAWKREDPRDVLVLREEKNLASLKRGAVIGTGSKRRASQLLMLRPDLKIVDIRGNVDTRLRKMEEQRLDGIVLAAAGLKRLQMEKVITQYLESDEMIPAPAQGILALELRADNVHLKEMLDALSDAETEEAAQAERGFLKLMGADCHVPVGAVCKRKSGGELILSAMFGDADVVEMGRDDTGLEEKSICGRLARVSVRGDDPVRLAEKAAAAVRSRLAGTVTLLGGGPGDPELITVKGLLALREADCVIYDRLSSPELLAACKKGCEKIYVGKANHHHTMPQDEINALLVEKAIQYRRVVRLKGGDVYVFGRGGEEGLYLRAHGVPFEVIPGISSALAGLAYAGIPITHRGLSTGFHVVTAHNRRDELADIDFAAMAKGRDTLVFLMGLSKLGEIVNGLLSAGMPEGTPAAVISHATCPDQKTCVAPLADIEQETLLAGLTSPALIVVGAVADLREPLNFYEKKPLFGKRYLVTKIGEEPSKLAAILRQNGAQVDELTTGRICRKTVCFTEQQFAETDWMLFTSRNGVEAFFENLFASELDVRALSGIKIAVIGEKTKEALKKYGLFADFVPKRHDSVSFAEELKSVIKKTDVVWYMKAEQTEGVLSEVLSKICILRESNVYENVPVEDLFWKKSSELVSGIETERGIETEQGIETEHGIKTEHGIEAEHGVEWEKRLLSYNGICFTCASSANRLLSGSSSACIRKLSEQGSVVSIGPQCTKALHTLGVDSVKQAKDASYEGVAAVLF